jgi:hypothetical protein
MCETKVHSLPFVDQSFGEPENVKQILRRQKENYDFNVDDDTKTRRFVGREGHEHRRRLEVDEGAEATGGRK